MYCKKCDLQLPDEAVFCPKCGSAVSDNTANSGTSGISDSSDTESAGPSATSATSATSASTGGTEARKKNKIIPIVAIGLAVIFVAIVAIVAIRMGVDSSQSNSYPKMTSLLVVQEEEGVLVYGESAKPVEINGALAYYLLSEDGSKACIATKNDSEDTDYSIWYCDSKNAVKVEEGISCFWISPTGNKIAYTVKQGNTEEYDLSIYDCTSKEASDLNDASGNDFVFSPDGRSYAYTGDLEIDNYNSYSSYVLYESVNGQSPKDIGENFDPVGLSNDGTYLYYLDRGSDFTDNDLYVQKGDKSSKLASSVSEAGSLNRDCSQMLYYKNDATYITVNGEKGEKISRTTMYICLPSNTQRSNRTLNVAGLTDQLYCANSGSGYSLTYLDSKYKESKIEDFSDYPVYDLSADGKSLALAMDNGKIKYYENYRDLEKDPVDIRTDENVLDLLISLDKSTIYFEDSESTLWSVRGEADPEDIADDLLYGSMSLSADGTGIYCVADWEAQVSNDDPDFGGTLYFISNTKGSKPVDVAEAVYYYQVSKYGVTYIMVTDVDNEQYGYIVDIYYSKEGMNANTFEQVSDSVFITQYYYD